MNADVCVMVLFVCITDANARLRNSEDEKQILINRDVNAVVKGPNGPSIQQRQPGDKTTEITGFDRPAGPPKNPRIVRQLEDQLVRTQRSVEGPYGPSGQPKRQSPGINNERRGEAKETEESESEGAAGPSGNSGGQAPGSNTNKPRDEA